MTRITHRHKLDLQSRVPEPDFELADHMIDELTAMHWMDQPSAKGMHSYGYTEAEQEAIDFVVAEATKQGMETFSDLAGNMYMVKRGSQGGAKTDVIVSHIDTVEKGGAHDGRDGIVAGMAVVAGFNKAGVTPPHDVCLMIARSEESCVNGLVSIGAKAAVGNITKDELAELRNRKTGRSVVAHMKELGIPVATLQGQLDANATLFPTGDTAKNLIGFLVEAHIEQGNYCAKQHIDVGVVDSIRGNARYTNSEIIGEAAHSGATYEEDRADAVRAYNKLMNAAETWFEDKLAQGHDIVYAPTVVSTKNTSPTTIANQVSFSFEIRSTEEALLYEFTEYMEEQAQKIERRATNKALKVNLPKPKISKPAIMDETLIQHAQHIAERQDINAGVITSGAGHDTVQFANSGTPSVMLFIRQHDPISHNPRESRDDNSFKDSCRIISGMVANPPEHAQDLAHIQRKTTSSSFTDYIKEQGATPYTPGQWRS